MHVNRNISGAFLISHVNSILGILHKRFVQNKGTNVEPGVSWTRR